MALWHDLTKKKAAFQRRAHAQQVPEMLKMVEFESL